MDSNVLIVLIVVVGLVVVVWLLRDRLTKFRVGGSVEKKEGEVSLEASPRESSGTASSKYGVDISGNKAAGKSKIDVSRPNVRVANNTSVGQSEIQVKDEKKPRK